MKLSEVLNELCCVDDRYWYYKYRKIWQVPKGTNRKHSITEQQARDRLRELTGFKETDEVRARLRLLL